MEAMSPLSLVPLDPVDNDCEDVALLFLQRLGECPHCIDECVLDPSRVR